MGCPGKSSGQNRERERSVEIWWPRGSEGQTERERPRHGRPTPGPPSKTHPVSEKSHVFPLSFGEEQRGLKPSPCRRVPSWPLPRDHQSPQMLLCPRAHPQLNLKHLLNFMKKNSWISWNKQGCENEIILAQQSWVALWKSNRR